MAAVTDPPVIHIDGVQLSASWSLRERVVIDHVTIVWGRRAHTDEAEPAQLALEVTDSTGHVPTSAAFVGKSITVTRGDGRVIFRGKLDDFEVSPRTIRDPLLNSPRRVWVMRLQASCKLAELALRVPPGPGSPEPEWTALFGEQHWPAATGADRMAQVRAAAPIVAGIGWADPYPPDLPSTGRLRYRSFGDNLSALDLIESAYNAHPLGYANYVPATDRVEIGTPAAIAGAELAWIGGVLRMTLPTGGTPVPARTVIVPDGYGARTTALDQIDLARVVGPRPVITTARIDWRDTPTERAVASVGDPLRPRHEFGVASDFMWTNLATIEEPGGTTFTPPFSWDTVTSEFGPRDGGFHEGIDFGNPPATAGADIHSIGSGTVVESRYHSGWGNTIVIDHGVSQNGKRLESRYAHMEAISPLAVGATVTSTSVLGTVGNTGNSFGAHLHLETYVDGTAIDPRVFFETYNDPTGGGEAEWPWPQGVWQRALADDLAHLFEQLNGKVSLPRVRFDWTRFEYPADVTAALIDTYAKQLPLYFPGSVFAAVTDAATEHQVIGGTLTYDHGWALDATLAPAVRTRGDLTLDQLVTIDAPTLSTFDPDMRVADLGNVTKGVTA